MISRGCLGRERACIIKRILNVHGVRLVIRSKALEDTTVLLSRGPKSAQRSIARNTQPRFFPRMFRHLERRSLKEVAAHVEIDETL